jgi:hypothetical protein
MNKKNIQWEVWIHRWIDIWNIMDCGENEFHKVKKEEIIVFLCEGFCFV